MSGIKNFPSYKEIVAALGYYDEEELSNEPEVEEDEGPHKCNCDIQLLLSAGCKCGGV